MHGPKTAATALKLGLPQGLGSTHKFIGNDDEASGSSGGRRRMR